jgi:hypothetical protein
MREILLDDAIQLAAEGICGLLAVASWDQRPCRLGNGASTLAS